MVNKKLKKLIGQVRDDAKNKKITNKVLAQRTNMSESQVSNYLKCKYRMPFIIFVEIVRSIYDNQEKIDDLINKFINSTNKPDNIKEALEWFSMNGDVKMVQSILKKASKDDAIYNIYRLLAKRNLKTIDAKEFYRKIDKIRDGSLNTPEEKALCRIATLNAHTDLNEYRLIPFLAEEAMKIVETISNQFLRKSYSIRLLELQAYSEMMRNNIEQSEKLAFEIAREENLSNFPIYVCAMYNLLSELYVFRSYDKAQEYNKTAFSVFRQHISFTNKKRLCILESTHDFINIFHGKLDNLFLNDPAEKAHYLIKKGTSKDIQNALEILENLYEKNGHLSPHQLYYKALATNNKKDMEISLNAFEERGNIFYSQLPKLKLRQN